MTDVPILMVIFNRPEKTRQVIEALSLVKPTRLFVAADGPRTERQEDAGKCRLAREMVTDIDWPCDLQTRFLDQNEGCDSVIADAIGWFFERVEYGIILEDDCVPHPHLFPFCEELFQRYADDQRVMQISGFAPYAGRDHPYDYHFSPNFRCWGWGTWSRAWDYFSSSLEQYSELVADESLKTYFTDYTQRRAIYLKFLQFKNSDSRSRNWDFLWNLACYAQNGLCIVPEANLVLNIGFDAEGTQTLQANPVFSDRATHPIQFPLRHPPFMYPDRVPERGLSRARFGSLRFKSRCMQQLRHALGTLEYFSDNIP